MIFFAVLFGSVCDTGIGHFNFKQIMYCRFIMSTTVLTISNSTKTIHCDGCRPKFVSKTPKLTL